MADSLRVDVLLHRLRLTRSRSEAKAACELGAVDVGGMPARASQQVTPGQRLRIRFPHRLLELQVLAMPGTSLSKSAAREYYGVLRDEPAPSNV
jgi:ribosomal 50S subunit-recycling heat shock protein